MTRHLFAVLILIALLGWSFGARRFALPPGVSRAAKATVGRLAVQDAGKTVLDRISGLHWQQGFSATTMSWTAAKTWCSANSPGLPGNDWRLPTVGELMTLVDRNKSSPAIDAAFAGTPSQYFWSSTPWWSGGQAWLVTFSDGALGFYPTGSTYRVRCVR